MPFVLNSAAFFSGWYWISNDPGLILVESWLLSSLVLLLVARCAFSGCRAMLAWWGWTCEICWLRLPRWLTWCVCKVVREVKFEFCSSSCCVFWKSFGFPPKCLVSLCYIDIRRRRLRSLGEHFDILDEIGLRVGWDFNFPFWSLRVAALLAALAQNHNMQYHIWTWISCYLFLDLSRHLGPNQRVMSESVYVSMMRKRMDFHSMTSKRAEVTWMDIHT